MVVVVDFSGFENYQKVPVGGEGGYITDCCFLFKEFGVIV